jgi:hydroxypyruvate isomerase
VAPLQDGTAAAEAGGALRFAANLKWLFAEAAVEQRFELAAQAGFLGVELPSPYELSPEVARKHLRDNGLHLVLINSPAGDAGSPTQWGSACLPDRVPEFRDGFRLSLEYAEALESDAIHVMGGVCPPDLQREVALATYVENIRWAAAEAASTNVRLVLEAINQHSAPGFVLDSVREAAAVVELVNTQAVGILFDVFHSRMNGDDVPVELHDLMPMVRHIQVADVPGRHEPGSGQIDWQPVIAEIVAGGYAGWIGCEYEPVAATQDGLHWRATFQPTGVT